MFSCFWNYPLGNEKRRCCQSPPEKQIWAPPSRPWALAGDNLALHSCEGKFFEVLYEGLHFSAVLEGFLAKLSFIELY